MNRILAPVVIASLGLAYPAQAGTDPSLSLASSTTAASNPSGTSTSGDIFAPSGSGAGSPRLPGGGSLLAGKTMNGGDAILAEFGWPGFLLTYLHSQTRTLDIGGTFTFNYGREGLLYIDPGIKLQGVVRLNLFDNGKINLGLRLDPGLLMYFAEPQGEGTAYGVTIPVSLLAGVSAGEAIMLHFGFDFPMLFRAATNDDFRFEFPFLFGVGVEYRVDSHLSLTFDCRFGPDVIAYSHFSETDFAFRALLGIGYRI